LGKLRVIFGGEPASIFPTQVEVEMAKESKTTLHGRDAKTGEFTTIKKAREQPNTHVVERVPKPGYGDTKKPK
jgi:hypothetical protein